MQEIIKRMLDVATGTGCPVLSLECGNIRVSLPMYYLAGASVADAMRGFHRDMMRLCDMLESARRIERGY